MRYWQTGFGSVCLCLVYQRRNDVRWIMTQYGTTQAWANVSLQYVTISGNKKAHASDEYLNENLSFVPIYMHSVVMYVKCSL